MSRGGTPPFWARLVGLEDPGGQEVLVAVLRSYKGFDAIPEAQGLYDPRNEKDRYCRDPKLRSSPIFFWAIKLKRMREFPSYFCFLADIIRPKNPPEYSFETWGILGLKGPSDAVGTPGLMSGVKMHL